MRKRRFICLFLLPAVSGLTGAWARQIVSGVVSEASGLPVIGANVIEKGTANGVITDLDGRFSIAVQSVEATLTVSYARARLLRLRATSFRGATTFSAREALRGRAAGLSVMRRNAVPGGETAIRIRGNWSLKAINDPLYVVGGILIAAGLNELSGSDIESIEILKDASATAVLLQPGGYCEGAGLCALLGAG
ncbi:MAG: carboxypeptidase-like regulatory domain-containing protein [Tannerellaceae bacterium]|nr:carboxypeptidase-like regulatory domain-containing protein [Tannerellaceae bacterium]